MQLGMGNKVTLIVVFSAILVLFFGMTLFDDAQAMKSKGNSLTEVSSKQVCGNFLCDEPMSIAEKIAIYLLTLVQQEETETEILQQSAEGIRNQQGIRMQIGEAQQRQTPKTDFGTMMKEGLSKSADTVLKSANIAAPFIPGGSVVSAAVSGMATMDVPTESGTQKIFVFAPEGLDINALVQWVLRESYMGNLEDMKYYAEKVRYYDDVKKGMRESLTEIRQYQSEYAPIESEEIYPDKYGYATDVQVKTLQPKTTISPTLNDATEQYLKSLYGINAELVTQDATFLSMQQVEEDITDLAFEIAENNKAQSGLREMITDLRNLAADPDSEYPASFTYTLNGKTETTTVNNAQEALALADKLESQLTILSDDSQMMQMELQDV